MPRSVLITTSTLVLLAALGGYWLGQRQLTLEASGVIEAVATLHAQMHGVDTADCAGWPGEGGAVFQVRCGVTLYQVDRMGRTSVVEDGGI
ncbi:hypothetical protein [uncultured Tateyamaria sp.]|uniref:hypothetical protein n=1 Tax=Tateyamaria sp. TaxID=1929288 RepID=UPI00261A1E7A|nr:hypothetical protein [uncultured Tateyamaria sp.]